MSDAPPIPSRPAGLPGDWLNQRDVPCPQCGYNLRMLSVPRCPECGSAFRWQQLLRVQCPRCNAALHDVDGEQCPRCALSLDWAALLDQAQMQDARLYEYSPHPARAALRTWLVMLVPWLLWRRVRLEMPPVVPRLRALRRAAVGLCVSGVTLIAVLSLANAGRWHVLSMLREQAAVYVLALLLPAVTTLGLPRFTPTLARFRIRDDQLLRCLAYGATGAAWLGAVFAGVFLAVVTLSLAQSLGFGTWIGRNWPVAFTPGVFADLLEQWVRYRRSWQSSVTGEIVVDVLHAVLLSALLFSFIWWWVYLYGSLRTYLRLDRLNAAALFLSTQTCGVLLLLLALLQLDVGTYLLGRIQLWAWKLIESLSAP